MEYLAFFLPALVFITVKTIYFVIRNVYLYAIPRDQRRRLRSLGQWAVVTGCTDGIGKEYALQLASLGFNIVLLARNAEKLRSVAEQVQQQCVGVKTRTLAVDFRRRDVYESVEGVVKDLDVGILVNNVGMGVAGESPRLGDKPREGLQDLIVCNCASMAAMSNLLLPAMQARRSGLIVNICSASGTVPTPFLTAYGATKSFGIYLSETIRKEYAEYGVQVQTAVPFFIATKLSAMRKTSFFVRSAQSFVKSHINTFGVASYVNGCVQHEIQNVILQIINSLPIRDTLLLRYSKKLKAKHDESRKEKSE